METSSMDAPGTPLFKLAFVPMAPVHSRPLQFDHPSLTLALGHAFTMEMPCPDCPRVIGAKSCHGVILVRQSCAEATFSVCNPSTGGVLRLPPPPQRRTGLLPGMGVGVTGIGYLAATGEYKVVQVCSTPTGAPECSVITVGDGRGWRVLAGEPCEALLDVQTVEDPDPVFSNGCLHWMCRTDKEYYHHDEPMHILAFSLADETFRRIPQPPFTMTDLVPFDFNSPEGRYQRPGASAADDRRGKLWSRPIGTAIAELDGRLCVMRDARRVDGADADAVFEVWRLQSYQHGTWTLDYRVGAAGADGTPCTDQRLLKPWLVRPLCYLDGDAPGKRVILLVTSGHDALVYNQDTRELETVFSVAGHDELSGNLVGKELEFLRLVMYEDITVHLPGMEYGTGGIEFIELE